MLNFKSLLGCNAITAFFNPYIVKLSGTELDYLHVNKK